MSTYDFKNMRESILGKLKKKKRKDLSAMPGVYDELPPPRSTEESQANNDSSPGSTDVPVNTANKGRLHSSEDEHSDATYLKPTSSTWGAGWIVTRKSKQDSPKKEKGEDDAPKEEAPSRPSLYCSDLVESGSSKGGSSTKLETNTESTPPSPAPVSTPNVPKRPPFMSGKASNVSGKSQVATQPVEYDVLPKPVSVLSEDSQDTDVTRYARHIDVMRPTEHTKKDTNVKHASPTSPTTQQSEMGKGNSPAVGYTPKRRHAPPPPLRLRTKSENEAKAEPSPVHTLPQRFPPYSSDVKKIPKIREYQEFLFRDDHKVLSEATADAAKRFHSNKTPENAGSPLFAKDYVNPLVSTEDGEESEYTDATSTPVDVGQGDNASEYTDASSPPLAKTVPHRWGNKVDKTSPVSPTPPQSLGKLSNKGCLTNNPGEVKEMADMEVYSEVYSDVSSSTDTTPQREHSQEEQVSPHSKKNSKPSHETATKTFNSNATKSSPQRGHNHDEPGSPHKLKNSKHSHETSTHRLNSDATTPRGHSHDPPRSPHKLKDSKHSQDTTSTNTFQYGRSMSHESATQTRGKKSNWHEEQDNTQHNRTDVMLVSQGTSTETNDDGYHKTRAHKHDAKGADNPLIDANSTHHKQEPKQRQRIVYLKETSTQTGESSSSRHRETERSHHTYTYHHHSHDRSPPHHINTESHRRLYYTDDAGSAYSESTSSRGSDGRSTPQTHGHHTERHQRHQRQYSVPEGHSSPEEPGKRLPPDWFTREEEPTLWDPDNMINMFAENLNNKKQLPARGALKLRPEFNPKRFLQHVPEMDSSGVPFPQWKRLVMAKQLAEQAQLAEDATLQRGEGELRLDELPLWKRALIKKHEHSTA